MAPGERAKKASRTKGVSAISSWYPAWWATSRATQSRASRSASRAVVRGEKRVEVGDRADPRLGRPVRGVLEGVGDAEEQVRDHHLAPRRLGQHRDRQREGAAGLLEEVLEGGHGRFGSPTIAARTSPSFSAHAATRRRMRSRSGIGGRMKKGAERHGGAADPSSGVHAPRKISRQVLVGRVADGAKNDVRDPRGGRGPGPRGRLHVAQRRAAPVVEASAAFSAAETTGRSTVRRVPARAPVAARTASRSLREAGGASPSGSRTRAEATRSPTARPGVSAPPTPAPKRTAGR